MYWPSENQLNKTWSKSVNKVVVPAFHQFTPKPDCFEHWFARNSLKSNQFLENTSRHILVFCGSKFPAIFTSSFSLCFSGQMVLLRGSLLVPPAQVRLPLRTVQDPLWHYCITHTSVTPVFAFQSSYYGTAFPPSSNNFINCILCKPLGPV